MDNATTFTNTFADTFAGNCTVLIGHAGVGKTNLALNLALAAAGAQRPVLLVDLDIVNPYFRSSDFAQLIESHPAGRFIELIAPTFAGTTLEAPSLPASIDRAFEPGETRVIIDVGGDDDGATVLGRYRDRLAVRMAQPVADAAVLYVVNCYRNLTPDPHAAAAYLHDIQDASGILATGLVNNSHLQDATDLDTIAAGLDFAQRTAQLTGLPLVATCVPRQLLAAVQADARFADVAQVLLPLDRLVTTVWERD
ncbi:MAG: ParA family protein [Actinomycetes bacterium]|jgi:energy-coupling factor transporter ATP-binding protein EcfA2|nr:ParA family protein [Actinomycetes bacterium]